jgi:hypothetical protein
MRVAAVRAIFTTHTVRRPYFANPSKRPCPRSRTPCLYRELAGYRAGCSHNHDNGPLKLLVCGRENFLRLQRRLLVGRRQGPRAHTESILSLWCCPTPRSAALPGVVSRLCKYKGSSRRSLCPFLGCGSRPFFPFEAVCSPAITAPRNRFRLRLSTRNVQSPLHCIPHRTGTAPSPPHCAPFWSVVRNCIRPFQSSHCAGTRSFNDVAKWVSSAVSRYRSTNELTNGIYNWRLSRLTKAQSWKSESSVSSRL